MAAGELPPNIRIVKVEHPTGKHRVFVPSGRNLLVESAETMIEQAVDVTTLLMKDGSHASPLFSVRLIAHAQTNQASFGQAGIRSCSLSSCAL